MPKAHLKPQLYVVATATVLAGCPQYEIENTGLATNLPSGEHPAILDTGHVAMAISEAAQGNTDLNGDGDTSDEVMHVVRPDGTKINLGLTGRYVTSLTGGYVAFTVHEGAQGNVDLNGDGVPGNAFVLHVWDAATETTTNVGVDAVGLKAFSQSAVAFVTIESRQGNTDLNGDGDTNDSVYHTWSPTVGLHNFGVVAASEERLTGGEMFVIVFEGPSNVDLNGDGDMVDQIAHIMTGPTTLINFAILGNSLSVPTRDGGIAFPSASILHFWYPQLGLINTGLVGSYTGGLPDGRVLIVLVESTDDLNGDGDVVDGIAAALDLQTLAVTHAGIAGRALGTDDGMAAVVVNECDEGNTDLNGDGDGYGNEIDPIYGEPICDDNILHTWNPQTGAVQNLGLAVNIHSTELVSASQYVTLVQESNQGDTDFNGDGDALDQVLHIYKTDTGLVNTNIAARDFTPLTNGLVAATVGEEGQYGADLNKDGDASDIVAMVIDPRTRLFDLLGAVRRWSLVFFPMPGGAFLYYADEATQAATDFNGDGDAIDTVWQVAKPKPKPPAP